MSRQRKNSTTTGFTLLEMLVALAVFTVAITLSLSSLLSVTSSQKKAVALQNVYDNIRFAFEAMSKEIRTGTSYSCALTFFPDSPPASANSNDCPGGGSALTFESSEGQIITYQFRDAKLQRGLGNVPGAQFYNLTAPEVRIDKLSFYVVSAAVQPRVTMILSAVSAGSQDALRSRLNLQTTVAQRAPEF